MPHVCRLHESPPTKDLRVAIDRLLQLCDCTEIDGETRAHVLIQTTHRTVAVAIAELLPADARGFTCSQNSNENRSAAEVLKESESRQDPTWHGSFSNEVASAAFRPLLVRLRDLAPDPLRRSSLNVRMRNFRWRGSPAHSTGTLELADFKVFQRKVRFRFQLGYETTDEISQAGLEAELTAIAEASGIDFRRGNCVRRVRQGAWSTAETAVASFLFREAVERVSQTLLNDGFEWSRLPGVFPTNHGVRRRFMALAQRLKEDFRWEADLTAFMRTAMPEFRAKKGIFADSKTYVAAFAEPWSIAVVVDTHPGLRIGRVFKLRCGLVALEHDQLRFKQSAPMLRCSGGAYYQHSDTCPEFSFNTRAELAAILCERRREHRRFLAKKKSSVRSPRVRPTGWSNEFPL